MTVQELTTKLAQFPPDAVVVVHDGMDPSDLDDATNVAEISPDRLYAYSGPTKGPFIAITSY